MNPTSFFALRESRELAAAVGAEANLTLARLEERDFEGGEFKLRPLESVRDREVFVLQCLAGAQPPVAERLLKLLFLLHGLRDAGAARTMLLLPYLTFARKERRTQPRDPVNSRYVAQLIESTGVARVITLDVHNPAALDNSFRIPVDHLSAIPMMVAHFVPQLRSLPVTVMSPDIGGVKRAQIFRELLEKSLERAVELAFLEKRRALGVVSGHTLVGEVRDRAVIILDDLCATGNTLIRAAEACNQSGAKIVFTSVTHTPYPAGLATVLAHKAIGGVVTTDSVGFDCVPPDPRAVRKLTVLSIAPLFGQAVQRILSSRPLTPLLERWPVAME